MSSTSLGHWRHDAGRDAYVRAYDAVMATLPEPERTWDAPTTCGTVRVYRFAVAASGADVVAGGDLGSGPTPFRRGGTTPLVFLPGWGAGAPMWGELLPHLEERPVYALDALGDAGMSEQTASLDTAAKQARWIDEALEVIGVEHAHVVGHSFGGWSAMNFALDHPERVASVSLFDPVQTFSSISARVVALSLPATLPFLPQEWRDAALAEIGGVQEVDKDDPLTMMIDAGTQFFVSKRAFPRRFTPEQLETLELPVFAAMAGRSAVLTSAGKAATFARTHVAHAEVSVWPQASHSLPFEYPAQLCRDLLTFVSSAEAAAAS